MYALTGYTGCVYAWPEALAVNPFAESQSKLDIALINDCSFTVHG